MTFFHRFSNILIECLEDLFYRWAVFRISQCAVVVFMTVNIILQMGEAGHEASIPRHPDLHHSNCPLLTWLPCLQVLCRVIIITLFVMSCYTSQSLSRHCHTFSWLATHSVTVVFWCTWCSLRCSHWTLFLSRIEHKANLLWIPADSDYNTKQVWKIFFTFVI